MSKENENMNLEQVSGGTIGEFDDILLPQIIHQNERRPFGGPSFVE